MTKTFVHLPVMPNEVMSFFQHGEGKVFVDATAGGGGHLQRLAEIVGAKGKVIGFDRDSRAHQDDAAGGVQKTYSQVQLIKQPFSAIMPTLRSLGITTIDGLLCDLGVSSHQLDEATRGFSFQSDGPIDMRMDPDSGMSAYEWLHHTSEKEIADVLFTLGGERKSRQIAARIKKNWPIENSSLALAQHVLSAMRQKQWSKIHPATRTFQALRMAVNSEVGELTTLLSLIPDLLNVGGVAVFLSFHSIEDRLIKNCFRELAQKNYNSDDKRFVLLTKKPLIASDDELAVNRRSRSAKLRAIQRVA